MASKSGTTDDGRALRVLLVEDDEPQAALLMMQLQRLGGSVPAIGHVESLKGAADLLKAESFDVVLLDLSLPDGWGIETLTTMLSLTGEHVPIVVFSGHSDERVRDQALQAGAAGFVVKGELTPAALLEVLHKIADEYFPP